ncbi:hypothetical protein DPMN_083902 [Dreissena polymorpha]|uniref:Uncharacterized protein n=1 Tax=Dreissena polymorpha TaxID=45954 RepID=A0A9D3YDL7_DREPO|nr:hypothetical protein DPMN_083902 [Dreissena polymorpha]
MIAITAITETTTNDQSKQFTTVSSLQPPDIMTPPLPPPKPPSPKSPPPSKPLSQSQL